MRFFERGRRTVWLRRRIVLRDDYGEPFAEWDQAVPLRVCDQPSKPGIQQRVFGVCSAERRVLYYDGPEAVLEGDGFCLLRSAEQEPDYRAISTAIWGEYQRVEIERVPYGIAPDEDACAVRLPGELAGAAL